MQYSLDLITDDSREFSKKILNKLGIDLSENKFNKFSDLENKDLYFDSDIIGNNKIIKLGINDNNFIKIVSIDEIQRIIESFKKDDFDILTLWLMIANRISDNILKLILD